MNSTIVTRFAPSPTGLLHLGHMFSALMAHDLARAAGGQFRLRIEDIDHGRSRAPFVDAIQRDLRWLDLRWDGGVVRQSNRLFAYRDALERLKEAGLVYPCFCTRADISAALTAPHVSNTAIYPGTCRVLDATTRAARCQDERFAWRIDMARAVALTGPLRWHDATAGWVTADPKMFGDVVLSRKDIPGSYHLCVTIDDAWQGVTDVVRGVDLFSATHIHRVLQAVLELPVPRYHHHRLICDAAGRRLAKRDGALAIWDLRQAGASPASLLSALRAGELPVGFDRAKA